MGVAHLVRDALGYLAEVFHLVHVALAELEEQVLLALDEPPDLGDVAKDDEKEVFAGRVSLPVRVGGGEEAHGAALLVVGYLVVLVVVARLEGLEEEAVQFRVPGPEEVLDVDPVPRLYLEPQYGLRGPIADDHVLLLVKDQHPLAEPVDELDGVFVEFHIRPKTDPR